MCLSFPEPTPPGPDKEERHERYRSKNATADQLIEELIRRGAKKVEAGKVAIDSAPTIEITRISREEGKV